MAEVKTRYGIPVGPDGYVPESELIKHFERVMAKRQREYDDERATAELLGEKMPNINLAKRDYDNTSDTVIPLKCTPEQVAAWWRDPSCCDVQDIDTAGAPKVNVPKDMTPEQQKLRARLWVFMAEIMEVTNNRMVQMSFQRLVSEGRVSGLELEELKANARNKNRELEIESLRAALAATGDRQFQTACYKELKAIARIAGGETKEAFRRIFDGLDMGR